jgi:hypothetical protein
MKYVRILIELRIMWQKPVIICYFYGSTVVARFLKSCAVIDNEKTVCRS